MVAIVGRGDKTDVLLIDTQVGKAVRSASKKHVAGNSMEAGEEQSISLMLHSDTYKKSFESKPWYKDGLAWTLVGTGLSALCGGIAIAQVYRRPSEQEVWAWTLIAAGAGALGTGAVLFFIPAQRRSASGEIETGMAIGFVGHIAF